MINLISFHFVKVGPMMKHVSCVLMRAGGDDGRRQRVVVQLVVGLHLLRPQFENLRNSFAEDEKIVIDDA